MAMAMVAVVFLMGGETVGASRRGQYSVANAGWCITVGAIQCCKRECGRCDKETRGGKEAGGGITHTQAKNPTTVTRRCGGNSGLGALVFKKGKESSSRDSVCSGTRCHAQHRICVTGYHGSVSSNKESQ